MKKFSLLAIIVSVAMVSCSNTYEAKPVELTNQTDSVNYFLGYVTANSLKMQMFSEIDSAKHKDAAAAFMDALIEGYTVEKKEVSQATELGKKMGDDVRMSETKGLIGVSAWGVNEKILFQGIANAIGGDTLMGFDQQNVMSFLQSKMQTAPQEEAVTPKAKKAKLSNKVKVIELTSLNDSLNYAYGVYMGTAAKMYVLANDTTGEAIDEFTAAFNKAISSKEKYPELVESGTSIGQMIKSQEEVGLVNVEGLATNFEVLKQGFVNGFNDTDSMSVSEMGAYIDAVIKNLRFGDKIRENQDWLKEKSAEDGVLATESGLLFEVVKMGKGPKPVATDKVKVHYEGTLIDGTKFDSSYDRGEPIEFALNQVIKGWTEGLQLMPVGSTFMLYIPSELGYGERGGGQSIPPFSTLIFKVELLGIVK